MQAEYQALSTSCRDLIPLCHIITEASTAIHMASPLAVTSILPFMKTTVHVFPKPIFQK